MEQATDWFGKRSWMYFVLLCITDDLNCSELKYLRFLTITTGLLHLQYLGMIVVWLNAKFYVCSILALF